MRFTEFARNQLKSEAERDEFDRCEDLYIQECKERALNGHKEQEKKK